MKVLVITPDRNVRKVDYTGAFLPESLAFTKYMESIGHIVETFRFDASASIRDRRNMTIAFLENNSDAEFIAFFCHGSTKSIQAGYREVYQRICWNDCTPQQRNRCFSQDSWSCHEKPKHNNI